MKRILILGSAPNAAVPCADVVYCANSSVQYYADKIKFIPSITSVVGSHLIAGVNASSASPSLKQVRSAILQSKMHEMIILEHEPWFNGWNIEQGILDVESSCGISPSLMKFNERMNLLKLTSGLEEPIFSYGILKELKRLGPWRFLRASKYLLRDLRKRGVKKPLETNPALRPSTGMWAAIAAMDRHGRQAKYFLSGISLTGFSDRSIHHNGQSQGQFEKFTHHLHADIRTLNALKKRYDVESIQHGMLGP